MSNPHITESIPANQAEAVAALAESARKHDGVAPLSEQSLLRVRHGAPSGTARFHLLHDDSGEGRVLVGFGMAERTPGEPDSAELVVEPGHRRRGHGISLLRSLREDAPADGLRVWAHGRLPGAVALAGSAELRQVRELQRMWLPLRDTADGPAPELSPPALSDVVGERLIIRSFEVGTDEDAWLKVNAAAFSDHPEQGGITLDDLRQREAEDWFDPNGLFVAEDTATGALAGFHWTKIHVDGAGITDGEPAGEVYVVGVAPEWRGTGLGRALTLVGLRYLRDRGLPGILLYVDESNRAATQLYESLGFTVRDVDVMYATR
ncbi:mycothiol synthase [Lipingzhangella halophila]|uniref:Mycothiol acetyltransferase n=1 Tax=Lipingzhangella halophila TaxID=1783352 RepID=A0A7W7RMI3_9ACTN|nr:mycothiol synthase [Lipingzhangella halophila]MBB4934181.1 mycothiol synthase [Lipingzhangella halophila]